MIDCQAEERTAKIEFIVPLPDSEDVLTLDDIDKLGILQACVHARAGHQRNRSNWYLLTIYKLAVQAGLVP